MSKDTPAARWREDGEPDPHDGRYDCKRSDLGLGHMTDDMIANAQYMGEGEIMMQTAVKDRIRWLSRQLENTNKTIKQLEKEKA